jgi:glutamate-ammonia-ligase adenylyltransferase
VQVAKTVSPSELKEFDAALASVPFRDRPRAMATFAHIAGRVPPGIAQSLPPLLLDTTDPDSALNRFERLVEESGSELLHMLDRHRFLIHYALALFGCSPWLGETLIQNTDLFHALARDKNFGLSHSREEYAENFARFRSRQVETDTPLLLARFKRREYVRIVLRDVLGIATLAEVTAEISALSDVLIEEAVREADLAMRNRYGSPQHLDEDGRLVGTPFTVLSLGKLGGNELNYSSDVDLMFIHGDGQEPVSAAISNHEYFVRLAQQVTEILSRMTREGAAFRIDLRLRPQGGEGDPAVGLSHAIDYYAHRAADWELQALIKVRHCAGDQALAREFIRNVQPFVYTEHVNFEAVETALEAREKMLVHRRRVGKADGIDVKMDRGGIRDIEFLVQCLQRVYGGTETWLRSGGTLFSLAKLHDKRHLSSKEFHDLTIAYEFLRKIEHRLQLRHGQQVHTLPTQKDELDVLERSIISGDVRMTTSHGLEQITRERMRAVREIYTRVIHHQQIQHERESAEDEFRLVSTGGFGREQEQRQILERLEQDSPCLYELARRSDLPQHVRRNLFRFLAAVFTSSERYRTLLLNADGVEHALVLFGASEYLTDILIRYPEEIGALAHQPKSAERDASPLFVGAADPNMRSDPIFEYVADPALQYEEKLSLLRRHYRSRAFELGARYVIRPSEVYEALADVSALDEAAIRAAVAIAEVPPGFAVLALGRLGTFEADLLSDADLLFVRDDSVDAVVATKKAEQIVEILSAYTRDGAVISVDTRLRPSGNEGELVVTPAHLDEYFRKHAQSWEVLTYSKLRYVAGEEKLARRATALRSGAYARFAAASGFADEIRDMRTKLEKSNGRDLKTGPGGAYDLDYIVGYLIVKHGLTTQRGNLRNSLRTLRDCGLLSEAHAEALNDASRLLRTVEHAIRLVMGKSRKTLPPSGPSRQAIEHLSFSALGSGHGFRDLDAVMQRTFLSVREIYCRIVK